MATLHVGDCKYITSPNFHLSSYPLLHRLNTLTKVSLHLLYAVLCAAQQDWPASSMVRIVFFYAEERDHMMMVVGNKKACELF